MTVYLDVLIALNALVDWLLLRGTARLLHTPLRRGRLLAGAALGGVLSCLILLPPLPTPVPLLLKVAGAAAMVAVAFPRGTTRAFFKRSAVFFLASALSAGGVSVLCEFALSDRFAVQNGMVYWDISPLMLAVFSVISYGAVTLLDRLLARKTAPGREYRLIIEDGHGTCICRALYDTGLHVREPFSGSPVVLVQSETVAPFLRRPVCVATAGEMTGSPPRMIPCRTVSGEMLLPAFRPKSLRLWEPGRRERDLTGTYVALMPQLQQAEFQALIGSDVLGG